MRDVFLKFETKDKVQIINFNNVNFVEMENTKRKITFFSNSHTYILESTSDEQYLENVNRLENYLKEMK